jgi:hypothetical protein
MSDIRKERNLGGGLGKARGSLQREDRSSDVSHGGGAERIGNYGDKSEAWSAYCLFDPSICQQVIIHPE